MASYRVHFVDHGGNVFDAMRLERDSDDAAIVDAHRFDVPSIGSGFEVWHDARLVHRHLRSTAGGFRQSAARYRSLSTLFRESGSNRSLLDASRSIEAQLSDGANLTAIADEVDTQAKVLLAKLDRFLARARSALRTPVLEVWYSADDVREEARLCKEEAHAVQDVPIRRSILAGASALIELADVMHRAGPSPRASS